MNNDSMNHNLRYILIKYIYNKESISELGEIIKKYIPCLNLEFDENRYTFTLKIKKTEIRKIPGFTHDPIFYYKLLSTVFMEFVNLKIKEIASILQNIPYNEVSTLYTVTCIGENLITIKL